MNVGAGVLAMSGGAGVLKVEWRQSGLKDGTILFSKLFTTTELGPTVTGFMSGIKGVRSFVIGPKPTGGTIPSFVETTLPVESVQAHLISPVLNGKLKFGSENKPVRSGLGEGRAVGRGLNSGGAGVDTLTRGGAGVDILMVEKLGAGVEEIIDGKMGFGVDATIGAQGVDETKAGKGLGVEDTKDWKAGAAGTTE